MKKKLLALAVAGAFVAPVAMADTTIYGVANVSFDNVKSGLTVGDATTNHVASNQSRLGFKGAEDLGGGTSAIYQIESAVNIDGNGAGNTATAGTTTLGGRNTFAGLKSDSMGTLVLGRTDSPYKVATRSWDMFIDTIADNRSIFLSEGRPSDTVNYTSPDMGGITLAIATVAGAETALNNTTKGSGWSFSGKYAAGPIQAALAYQTATAGTTGTGTLGAGVLGIPVNDKVNAWKIGGSYAMDAFAVNAIYEKTGSSGTIGNAADRSAWYLAGKFNVSGNDAVKLAYTSAGKINSINNTDANQVSLGYDHGLSKRTTVYALYTKISNKSAIAYALGGISTSGAASALDADPSAFSLGMKHTF